MIICKNLTRKNIGSRVSAIAIVLTLSLISASATCQDKKPLSSQIVMSNEAFNNHLIHKDSKTIIEDTVKGYLLEHPEIIVDAILSVQNKQQARDQDAQKQNLAQLSNILSQPDPGSIIGNPEGEVVITEFFDYNCGYCKLMLPRVLNAVKNNNNLQLVLIEFPILGPSSTLAAKAALAARDQGLYFPFHQNMMEFKGTLNSETINSIAKAVGLDVKRLNNDMKNPKVDERIERNKSIAEQLNINGTPAFIVGEEVIAGAISENQLIRLVNIQTEKLK